jgi:molybdopterin synthase sulfur carrier subunit
MAKQRVKFTFVSELITLPIIYELGKNFSLVTNIRRADVTEDRGWVILEIEGQIEEIERGLEWVASKGVRVDPVQGDIVEGERVARLAPQRIRHGRPPMAKIRIPTPLRKLTNDAEVVTADAPSLGEAIDRLEGAYPGLKDRICDEAGEIRRFVNIYVNGEDVRFLDNLQTKLSANDDVSIVPAVAGGA